MRKKICGALAMALLCASAHAGYGELTGKVESDTCRLANAYTLGNQDYSGSAGTTFNGSYEKAKDRGDCIKRCESEEKSRREEKPSMYGIRVACFYGGDKLFERSYK
jgi:hypothetical protein